MKDTQSFFEELVRWLRAHSIMLMIVVMLTCVNVAINSVRRNKGWREILLTIIISMAAGTTAGYIAGIAFGGESIKTLVIACGTTLFSERLIPHIQDKAPELFNKFSEIILSAFKKKNDS